MIAMTVTVIVIGTVEGYDAKDIGTVSDQHLLSRLLDDGTDIDC